MEVPVRHRQQGKHEKMQTTQNFPSTPPTVLSMFATFLYTDTDDDISANDH